MAAPAKNRRFEWRTLLALLLVGAAVVVFVQLGNYVTAGEVSSLDRRLLLALRSPGDPDDPLGPLWMEGLVRDVTALGSTVVLLFLTLAAAGVLGLTARPRAASLLVVAVTGGQVLSAVLKSAYARPRPDLVLVPQYAESLSASFPSGHTTMSAVVYLTLAAVAARYIKSLRLKSYLFALAAGLTLAVGVSRVYLGVHWPSDVLAGWLAGCSWACLAWLALRTLQDRGGIEQMPVEEDLA